MVLESVEWVSLVSIRAKEMTCCLFIDYEMLVICNRALVSFFYSSLKGNYYLCIFKNNNVVLYKCTCCTNTRKVVNDMQ